MLYKAICRRYAIAICSGKAPFTPLDCLHRAGIFGQQLTTKDRNSNGLRPFKMLNGWTFYEHFSWDAIAKKAATIVENIKQPRLQWFNRARFTGRAVWSGIWHRPKIARPFTKLPFFVYDKNKK